MLWKDVATLIATQTVEDNEGFDEEIITEEKEVFVDVQSTRRAEFYAAKQTGIDIKITFMIRSVDYSDESYIKHNGVTYKIIRDFTKGGENYELNCALASLPGTVARRGIRK